MDMRPSAFRGDIVRSTFPWILDGGWISTLAGVVRWVHPKSMQNAEDRLADETETAEVNGAQVPRGWQWIENRFALPRFDQPALRLAFHRSLGPRSLSTDMPTSWLRNSNRHPGCLGRHHHRTEPVEPGNAAPVVLVKFSGQRYATPGFESIGLVVEFSGLYPCK